MPAADILANAPLLSIIIPVYNAERTLTRTLASLQVIAPDHQGAVEVWLIDDGLQDGSLALIRKECETCKDFNWHVIAKSNGGAASARNAALVRARGEWVLFLDADDELLVDPLRFILSAGQHSCLGFTLEYLRSPRFRFSVRPRRIGPANHLAVLTAANPFQPSSLVFRRRH